ncbi:hypothetical protein BASA82_000685 [Batrachochytrium salamandrivorans]|nr:hypothetical protein BASA82_000685 [Batrachochytrium salamandrivorans]
MVWEQLVSVTNETPKSRPTVGSDGGDNGIVAADYVGKRFPVQDREWLIGREDRVQLQSVSGLRSACVQNVHWVDAESPNNVTDVSHNKHPDAILVDPRPLTSWIAGAIFSWNKIGLNKYAEMYYIELQRYLDADLKRYGLIDHFLMGAMACRYDFVEVVRPPIKCCRLKVSRAWFFMVMFYTNATYPQTALTDAERESRLRLGKAIY